MNRDLLNMVEEESHQENLHDCYRQVQSVESVDVFFTELACPMECGKWKDVFFTFYALFRTVNPDDGFADDSVSFGGS